MNLKPVLGWRRWEAVAFPEKKIGFDFIVVINVHSLVEHVPCFAKQNVCDPRVCWHLMFCKYHKVNSNILLQYNDFFTLYNWSSYDNNQ